MRLIYDEAADAAFLYFSDEPAEVARTDLCDVEMTNASVILLFSPEDQLAGFEILGAAKLLSQAALSRAETQ